MRNPIVWLAFFAIVLRFASAPTANASYVILAIYALADRRSIIYALGLSCLFTMVNGALFPEASDAATGRYIVILAAAISVGLRHLRNSSTLAFSPVILQTGFLGVLLLIHSVFFSEITDVSVLKVTSWTVTVLTLVASWREMRAHERDATLKKLELGIFATLLFSFPLFAIPSIGYSVNGDGFQGIFNHPQVFGSVAALGATLTGGRIWTTARLSVIDLSLFCVAVFLVIASEARTAGLAMALGLLGSVLISGLRGVPQRQVNFRNKRFAATFGIAGLIFVICIPFTAPRIESYLFKRSDAASLVEAADASRGALISRMLANIEMKPLTGIGFGIGSDSKIMEVRRDPLFGFPVSALVEKGVMPVAVIEELGFIFAVAVFAWFSALVLRSVRRGSQQLAITLTVLFLNLGESTLFSAGGVGLLLLILLSAAAAR
jgi:hypothetical protein